MKPFWPTLIFGRWTGAWCATVSATGLHRWSSEGWFRFTLVVVTHRCPLSHKSSVTVERSRLWIELWSNKSWNILKYSDCHSHIIICHPLSDLSPNQQGFGPILDQSWHQFVSPAGIFADGAAQEFRELPMARAAADAQYRAAAGGGRKEAHLEGRGRPSDRFNITIYTPSGYD